MSLIPARKQRARKILTGFRYIFGAKSPSDSNSPLTSGVTSSLPGLFSSTLSGLPNRTSYTFFPPKKWTELRSCIWKGPTWYRLHKTISKISEYKNLQHLFVEILNVALEPQLDNFLDYLEQLKNPRLEHRRVIIDNIYDELNAEAQRDPSSESRIR